MDNATADAVAGLKNTDGWKALTRVFADIREQQYQKLARQMMLGRYPDASELDYRRGYFKGIEDLLGAPDIALRQLQKLMESDQ